MNASDLGGEMRMKQRWVELSICLLCIVGLTAYWWLKRDKNPSKSHRMFTIQVGQQSVPVWGVKIVQIPQAVYDGMAQNPQWKEHLLGDKKRVLLFTWPGCPYQRAFRQAFEKAFSNPLVSIFYVKDIVETGSSVSGTCLDKNCPKLWLMEHCLNGWCIINPMTKEALIDNSKDAKQIVPIITAYATWNDTPLVAKTK